VVLNAGSSSLKFRAYRIDGATLQSEARGHVDGIGGNARFIANDRAGAVLSDDPLPTSDMNGAFTALVAWLRERYRGRARLRAVGHRVVHGGERYAAPTRVTPRVLDDLRRLTPLAPLHQPHNVAGIDAIERAFAEVVQVACFDTGFHRSHPPVARIVPLPRDVRGVQRYGFHGLSYEYIASALAERAPTIASGRVIAAHLGNGASLCAMHNGASLDSTFGFTTLDGLCMGTRPGAIDPGVVLHLIRQLGLSAVDVETMLYRKSGLLGISNLSNDMRILLASAEPAAQLAVDYFVYRATKEIGALTAVLGGIDALVFSGGIGENSPDIRARICDAAAWLGVKMDRAANALHGPCISAPDSRVAVWVIPTDEETMIARHVAALLMRGDE
jgi:acetate kinase